MNTNQINSFLCVAKHLSFSKAAEELFIAQSSVSRNVALMDYWSRYRGNPMLRYLGIDLPLPIVLAWRREAENPAIREFTACTAEFFAQQ